MKTEKQQVMVALVVILGSFFSSSVVCREVRVIMLLRRDKSELGESCGDDAEQASPLWSLDQDSSIISE